LSFNFFKSGPPPPRVALLSDALFFVRAVPLPAGDQEALPADIAAQVELALESASPFPLSQLYYGYFWAPGSRHALAFAAYRRRFTAEQVAGWQGAEVVLPTFAALLGATVEPATTVVLATAEGLTAIHWGDGPVPSKVVFQPLAPETSDDDKERIRTALFRAAGDTKTVVDLDEPPAAQSRRNDREIVFRSGNIVSPLSAAAAAALDVRDRDELVALRRAHKRDVLIWRVGIGCVAAFAAMVLCELALLGGGLLQQTRLKVVRMQTPIVDSIVTAQVLANQINNLSTKRLLPIEMIKMVAPRKFGTTIQFVRVSTDGLYTLTVAAKTSNPGEISTYRNSLEALPDCNKVEIKDLRTQNNVASFTLVITFKPDRLTAASPAS
jgi:hypothetical protein